MTASTRERLLRAALRLFAERGFHRTTVGDIEEAAGFTRRGGTVYKHFSDKRSMLEAALERHVERVRSLRKTTSLLPPGRGDADLTLLLRSLLVELADEREITAVLEMEGSSFPELRDRFYRDLIEPGFEEAAKFVRRTIAPDDQWDADAVAVIAIGALVNVLRNQWTFGATPLDVPPDRVAQTVVQLLASLRDERNRLAR